MPISAIKYKAYFIASIGNKQCQYWQDCRELLPYLATNYFLFKFIAQYEHKNIRNLTHCLRHSILNLMVYFLTSVWLFNLGVRVLECFIARYGNKVVVCQCLLPISATIMFYFIAEIGIVLDCLITTKKSYVLTCTVYYNSITYNIIVLASLLEYKIKIYTFFSFVKHLDLPHQLFSYENKTTCYLVSKVANNFRLKRKSNAIF